MGFYTVEELEGEKPRTRSGPWVLGLYGSGWVLRGALSVEAALLLIIPNFAAQPKVV